RAKSEEEKTATSATSAVFHSSLFTLHSSLANKEGPNETNDPGLCRAAVRHGRLQVDLPLPVRRRTSLCHRPYPDGAAAGRGPVRARRLPARRVQLRPPVGHRGVRGV